MDTPEVSSLDFSSIALDPALLQNIASLGYSKMTEIQAQSLPLILEGRDLLAQAKTGSGKTAAFAIGLLNKLDVSDYRTQAMVITPTRELADQVTLEIRRLARAIPNTKILTLCGGKPMGPQLASLQRNPHIVIGTPGRLLKLLEKGALNTAHVKTLVLDEADRMLDLGFHDDIIKVIKRTPPNRQTLLFSATYPDLIQKISKSVQNDPAQVRVQALHDKSVIRQIFYGVNDENRIEKLIAALNHHKPDSVLVFCTTRLQCQSLVDDMQDHGYSALALHGELDQFDRDEALVQFANKSVRVLIATDVAARGLDIKDLAAVVNYELTPDAEIHVHRIGRTGRAGKEGLAISLVSQGDAPRLAAIEEFTSSEITVDMNGPPKTDNAAPLKPSMSTLFIHAGRKNKIRPGDILGALTADKYLPADKIGKIDIFDSYCYVAVQQGIAKQALKILMNGNIKGRKFRARKLG